MSSTTNQEQRQSTLIQSLSDFAKKASYSLLESLTPNPDYKEHRPNKNPRQVKSGHYVPVYPTALPKPIYVAHSKKFFQELGLADSLATSDEDFMRVFSGDVEGLEKEGKLPPEMSGGDKTWATGYALSIMGREYYEQCPFRNGNGYGDGRAMSVFEGVFGDEENKRFEFQLKGGGRTNFCRHADGRAVLRSSIREFLAQEANHALGVSTSRSLTLYVSEEETVKRPWYSENSESEDPDTLVSEPVAITTRVAPSFLRVGQLELFGRRARKNEHPNALKELEQIVQHAIQREYKNDGIVLENVVTNNNIKNTNEDAAESSSSSSSSTHTISKGNREAYLKFAEKFQDRLTTLIANWIRVGFVQGNFNSDNTLVAGRTFDYGPFGYVDNYNPSHQMWTGGGEHFSFMNQPNAGQQNFKMFCIALFPLFKEDEAGQEKLQAILSDWPRVMGQKLQQMFASKLGLLKLPETPSSTGGLLSDLEKLLQQTPADYTIFFRELSKIPQDIEPLKKSFYSGPSQTVFSSLTRGRTTPMHPTWENDEETMTERWTSWLSRWHEALKNEGRDPAQVSQEMLKTNPKYILREFLVAPAYQEAMKSSRNFSLVRELYEVMTNPYDGQSKEVEEKYYRKKPLEAFEKGGISHCSCSS